jgi:uncharacterized protein (TIGR03545 family)
MRKKGLIFLIIVAALVVFLNSVVTDRWMERGIERFASRRLGARVELTRLDFSLVDLSLGWERLQVTDPDNTWTNLFETGSCSFNLAVQPLLQRKVVVEVFDVQGLRFGTPRETDGALSGVPRGRAPEQSKIVQSIEQNISAEIESYPLLNLGLLKGSVDLDALWDEADLQSPERIKAMKDRFIGRYRQWEERIEGLPGESQFADLQRDIAAIETGKIDSPQEAARAYETLQSIERRNREYQNNVRLMRDEFDRERIDIADLKGEIDALIEEDYKRVLAMAGLPEFSRETIAAMIFGRPIAGKMEKVLSVLGRVRRYSQKVGTYIPAKEFPPRGMGQDIVFSTEQDVPRFWIKTIRLSGETRRGIGIGGEMLHLVSNQRKIDRPTTLQLGGSRDDGAGLDVAALVDGRGDEPMEQFDLMLRRIPLEGMSITEFPFLDYPLANGVADLSGKIDFRGSHFIAEIGFSGRDVVFDTGTRPESLDEDLYELSRAMIGNITDIELLATVDQRGDDFRLDMRSNLDDIVLEALEQVASDEVRAVQRELMERIEGEIGLDRAEVETLVAEGEDYVETGIGNALAGASSVQSSVEQKRYEIDLRLEEEEGKVRKEAEEKLMQQQKTLEEKGEDVLDSLF